MENNDKFTYTYSAPTEAERREIESIRRQYVAEDREVSKADRLRSLHSAVVGKATAVSLALGVVGMLVFGGGMALALEFDMLLLGIVLAIIGSIPIALAYPIYKRLYASGKRKYGDEIIRLSDELLGE
nr:hypothetical protein [Oscillospiraceae bacterium]